jgi:5'(3')-deoxyribonucleotidase
MKTVYLDMDGVVADFDEYANRTLGLPPSEGVYPDDVWNQLASNGRIYRDLLKTSYADQLVNYCRDFCEHKKYHLKFLSAVPKGNDVPWAFTDKIVWAQLWFPDIPVMFGPFSKDKHMHCKKGDILIDDRRSNIEEWRAAGGIAILHNGNWRTTIKELEYYEDTYNRT